MAFPFRSLFSLPGKKLTEQQKLERILTAAAAQKAELHLVFGQRLARPVPIRGRFMRVDESRILISLDTSGVYDAWEHEPCSVYFSVRCAELSGSYAFTTRMLANETRDNTTRALIALPTSYTPRQVRRFERLSPGTGMVQRMAVWNLKAQEPPDSIPKHLLINMRTQPPRPASTLLARLDEGPPLVARLPAALQDMGPADFLHIQNKKACELVNVSAGGARMRLIPPVAQAAQAAPYEEGDNILLLLALTRPKATPLVLSLAGVCCGISANPADHDVKMRFLYWNHTEISNALSWAPVSLRGVTLLHDWVAHGLGFSQAPRGIETSFDAILGK